MKIILKFILKNVARCILWRHKPIIIAVTGSVGKTSVRDAIFSILSKRFSVRKSAKNYNNEIGVPLSIIGVNGYVSSFSHYFLVILKGIYLCFLGEKQFPKYLILEIGADRPGDIKYITSFVKPTVAIVTAIGEIPVHIEFFSERDALIKEKFSLLEALPKNGIAILNYDDLSIRGMKKQLPEDMSVINYGFGSRATVRAENYKISGMDNNEELFENLEMIFKINSGGSVVPVKIKRLLGRSQAHAVLAASAVAFSLGFNLLEISEGLSDHTTPLGRMKFLKGVKKSYIIDDTYNSSPLAMISALESLEKFKDYKKIAVIGDMMELGEYTEKAHREIGKKAVEICDLIITVGPRAKFIYDEALSLDFDRNKLFHFDQHQLKKAGNLLESKIESGDVILVKGSQSMRMERIVKEVMAEPERASELLVRQEWQDA